MEDKYTRFLEFVKYLYSDKCEKNNHSIRFNRVAEAIEFLNALLAGNSYRAEARREAIGRICDFYSKKGCKINDDRALEDIDLHIVAQVYYVCGLLSNYAYNIVYRAREGEDLKDYPSLLAAYHFSLTEVSVYMCNALADCALSATTNLESISSLKSFRRSNVRSFFNDEWRSDFGFNKSNSIRCGRRLPDELLTLESQYDAFWMQYAKKLALTTTSNQERCEAVENYCMALICRILNYPNLCEANYQDEAIVLPHLMDLYALIGQYSALEENLLRNTVLDEEQLRAYLERSAKDFSTYAGKIFTEIECCLDRLGIKISEAEAESMTFNSSELNMYQLGLIHYGAFAWLIRQTCQLSSKGTNDINIFSNLVRPNSMEILEPMLNRLYALNLEHLERSIKMTLINPGAEKSCAYYQELLSAIAWLSRMALALKASDLLHLACDFSMKEIDEYLLQYCHQFEESFCLFERVGKIEVKRLGAFVSFLVEMFNPEYRLPRYRTVRKDSIFSHYFLREAYDCDRLEVVAVLIASYIPEEYDAEQAEQIQRCRDSIYEKLSGYCGTTKSVEVKDTSAKSRDLCKELTEGAAKIRKLLTDGAL